MIILGGGVAGLAASIASGAPVYEAGPVTGGVAQSRKIDGFAFDHGIHVLQTENPTIHALFKQIGLGLSTRKRYAYIYSHSTYTAYPFQVNTAGLPVGLRARCVWRYLRRDRGFKPANYAEWIYQTIGEGFADTFLIPYSEKFWTVHPREMTYDWTGNRVPSVNLWQVLRGAFFNKRTAVGSNATFQYPDHGVGFGAIPDQMAGAAGEIHLNHRATRIDAVKRVVEFNGGSTRVPYDTLISTIPLPALVGLIPEAPREVVEAAARLRSNSILVVNLGIDRAPRSGHHWVHFPEDDISFFRISYPHNLGPGNVPDGMSAVSAEVSYSPHRPVDKATITDRVTDDLIRVGVLAPTDRIVVKDVMDIRYAYVIYDQERKHAARTIHGYLNSCDIHSTGRYGLWAYLWSHESITAGLQAGQRLAGNRVESA